MCWTLLHLFLLNMLGFPKTPGACKITFDFMVKMLADANGTELFTSLIVSAINANGPEFNIAPHSAIKVCKDSVSKLFLP